MKYENLSKKFDNITYYLEMGIEAALEAKDDIYLEELILLIKNDKFLDNQYFQNLIIEYSLNYINKHHKSKLDPIKVTNKIIKLFQ